MSISRKRSEQPLMLAALYYISFFAGQDSAHPLFIVDHGTVKLDAKGWIPKHTDGGKVMTLMTLCLFSGAHCLLAVQQYCALYVEPISSYYFCCTSTV